VVAKYLSPCKQIICEIIDAELINVNYKHPDMLASQEEVKSSVMALQNYHINSDFAEHRDAVLIRPTGANTVANQQQAQQNAASPAAADVESAAAIKPFGERVDFQTSQTDCA